MVSICAGFGFGRLCSAVWPGVAGAVLFEAGYVVRFDSAAGGVGRVGGAGCDFVAIGGLVVCTGWCLLDLVLAVCVFYVRDFRSVSVCGVVVFV